MSYESDADPGTRPQPKKNQWVTFLKELPFLVVGALIIAVLIKSFLVQVFYIPTGSMLDTLQINDKVIVNKLAYQIGDPNRGDVVVFEPEETLPGSLVSRVTRNLLESVGLSTPESDLIKRVIGLPGDTVAIRDGVVLVNGYAISEAYLPDDVELIDFGPVSVPADHYFVMGDNRGSSRDSRFTGSIERDRIVGRAFAIIWPPADWSGL